MTSSPFFLSPGVAQGDQSTIIDDMIVWWKLDEGAGTVANDSTANNDDGTFVGGVTWQTSGKVYTNVPLFDGSSGRVDSLDFFYSDAFTLACWVKLSTVTAKHNSVFLKRNNTNTANDSGTYEWAIYVDNGVVNFHIVKEVSGYAAQITSSTSLTVDTWHHLAGVARGDGNTSEIYIDGVSRGSATQAGVVRNTTCGIQLACRSVALSARYLHGYIQDARIYNRGLTEEQVAYLHSSTNV